MDFEALKKNSEHKTTCFFPYRHIVSIKLFIFITLNLTLLIIFAVFMQKPREHDEVFFRLFSPLFCALNGTEGQRSATLFHRNDKKAKS
jgi:hypothetical protein